MGIKSLVLSKIPSILLSTKGLIVAGAIVAVIGAGSVALASHRTSNISGGQGQSAQNTSQKQQVTSSDKPQTNGLNSSQPVASDNATKNDVKSFGNACTKAGGTLQDTKTCKFPKAVANNTAATDQLKSTCTGAGGTWQNQNGQYSCSFVSQNSGSPSGSPNSGTQNQGSASTIPTPAPQPTGTDFVVYKALNAPNLMDLSAQPACMSDFWAYDSTAIKPTNNNGTIVPGDCWQIGFPSEYSCQKIVGNTAKATVDTYTYQNRSSMAVGSAKAHAMTPSQACEFIISNGSLYGGTSNMHATAPNTYPSF